VGARRRVLRGGLTLSALEWSAAIVGLLGWPDCPSPEVFVPNSPPEHCTSLLVVEVVHRLARALHSDLD